jgi:TfoX/Sxy family transcriptional regulator of competence genes
MTSDLDLAANIRSALSRSGTIREVKMFGGIGFMLNGHLVAAASKRGLLLRVGEDGQGEGIALGARAMVMRGRTMKDYVYVDPGAIDARAVKNWVRLAVTFVKTLPPKPSASRSKPKRGTGK